MTPQRIVPQFEEALPFKVNGVYCRFIRLSRGLIAIVNADHYEDLMRWGWYALSIRGKFYAARKTRLDEKEKRETILMHRYLLGLHFGDERQGDHKNLDSLNNLLTDNPDTTNLRIASDLDNRHNTGKRRTNTSGFKCVRFDKKASPNNPWSSRIRTNGKEIHLGMHATPELASKAYDEAAKKYFGKFARSK
jgi:hypothetical protein